MRIGRTLSARLSHDWGRGTAVFDDENLVSSAGLVPVMALAEQTGLPDLLEQRVVFRSERIRSGAANPAAKLTAVIAGMAAGADSVDDLDVVRAGGMKNLFGAVYAPSTLGILLRQFTTATPCNWRRCYADTWWRWPRRPPCWPGSSNWRSWTSTRCCDRSTATTSRARRSATRRSPNQQVLRRACRRWSRRSARGRSAPVIAGVRLRAGKAGSGKGAASMVTEAINTAKAAGATTILVRGDSAYGNGKVIAAVVKAGAKFSFVLTKNQSVDRAIGAIADDAWTPVHYPGAVTDPDTGELISDAEVAEIEYTAFASTAEKITARLIVRRVRDRNHPDELFPVWRYHPFFTNSTAPVTAADITHRQHAIIESVFADVIDGPLAHLPSGSFPQTAPGRCSPRSPTTCSAPPAPSPERPTRWPAGRPCAGTW